MIEISGEVQGIAFQMLVLAIMFFVPFWERGKRKSTEKYKANKIVLAAAGFVVLFLIMGIISNLRRETGFQGIILHLLVIMGFLTMPYWFGVGGRSVWRKKPLFLGTLIAIIGFIYVTVKGVLI